MFVWWTEAGGRFHVEGKAEQRSRAPFVGLNECSEKLATTRSWWGQGRGQFSHIKEFGIYFKSNG